MYTVLYVNYLAIKLGENPYLYGSRAIQMSNNNKITAHMFWECILDNQQYVLSFMCFVLFNLNEMSLAASVHCLSYSYSPLCPSSVFAAQENESE